jgi:uncharacterized membrane protein
MLDSFINIRLLADPMNWLIVTLVLIFGAYGAYLVYSHASDFTPSLPAA